MDYKKALPSAAAFAVAAGAYLLGESRSRNSSISKGSAVAERRYVQEGFGSIYRIELDDGKGLKP